MMSEGLSPESVSDFVAEIKKVGSYQLDAQQRGQFRVETKSHASDMVTEVDKESELRIKALIAEYFPGDCILGEESSDWVGGLSESFEYCRKKKRVWVVDPIDGTTSFVMGLPIFSISIALVIDAKPVFALIHAPALRQTFQALAGQGATLNGRAILCSSREQLSQSVLGTGFPYDKHSSVQNNLKEFSRLMPLVRGIRRMGSAAYDLACVASGKLDGFWEMNLNIWDVAAGILLVQEAGGCIIELDRNRKVSIVAGNRLLCGKILEQISDV